MLQLEYSIGQMPNKTRTWDRPSSLVSPTKKYTRNRTFLLHQGFDLMLLEKVLEDSLNVLHIVCLDLFCLCVKAKKKKTIISQLCFPNIDKLLFMAFFMSNRRRGWHQSNAGLCFGSCKLRCYINFNAEFRALNIILCSFLGMDSCVCESCSKHD